MDDRAKVKTLLGPALAVGGIILLVGIVIAVGQADPAPPKKGDGDASAPAAGGPPRTLSDGTAPGAADPALQDLGDGLKVRDLKVGDGPEVQPGAQVVMHYTGWLLDGSPFDSSRTTGKPLDYPLGRLIKGWQKGIPGMKPGGVRKLVIPPELGYGDQDQEKIPPNSTLVFEVELIRSK